MPTLLGAASLLYSRHDLRLVRVPAAVSAGLLRVLFYGSL